MKRNTKESIWKYVEKDRVIPINNPSLGSCWLWTGHTNQQGYGQIRICGILYTVHRIAYELQIGPIPLDHEVDHLCLTRNCVRASHLEPVTRAENLRRMPLQIRKLTHCKRMHELTEGNFYWIKAGKDRGVVKRCKLCEKIWQSARKLRKQTAH